MNDAWCLVADRTWFRATPLAQPKTGYVTSRRFNALAPTCTSFAQYGPRDPRYGLKPGPCACTPQ